MSNPENARSDGNSAPSSLVSHDVEQFFLSFHDRVDSAPEAIGHGIGLGSGDPELAPGSIDHRFGLSRGVFERRLLDDEGALHGLFHRASCRFTGLLCGARPVLEDIQPDPVLLHDEIYSGLLYIRITIESAVGQVK